MRAADINCKKKESIILNLENKQTLLPYW